MKNSGDATYQVPKQYVVLSAV